MSEAPHKHKKSISEAISIAEEQRILPRPVVGPEARTEGYVPISQALRTMAEERGEIDAAGNFDLSGLYLQQGNLTYMVRQRAVTVQAIEYRRTGEKQKIRSHREASATKPKAGKRFTPTNELFKRRKVLHSTDRLFSAIDLDVYGPGGELLSKISFDGLADKVVPNTTRLLDKYRSQTAAPSDVGIDQFMDFIDSHARAEIREPKEKRDYMLGHYMPSHLVPQIGNTPLPRNEINPDSINWAPNPPPGPPAELNPTDRQYIDLALTPDGDGLTQVLQRREQLNIPGDSLRGLTLMRGAHKIQITQDRLIYTPTSTGSKFERICEIIEYDGHGRPVRQEKQVYRFAELRNLLNERNPQDPTRRNFADPHWEIEKATLDKLRTDRHDARIGRLALGTGTPNRLRSFLWGGQKMSHEEALMVLHGTDIYTEGEVREKMAERKSVHELERDNKLAESLRRTVMRFGAVEVNNLAEQLRNKYILAVAALGLPVPLEKTSLSLALRAIAEQRLDTVDADDTRRSLDLGDPLAGNPGEAKRARRAIVNYEIALICANTVIQGQLDGDPVKAVDEDGFIEMKNEATLKFVVSENFLDGIQEFARDEVGRLLEKIADSRNLGKQPQANDLLQLGWWLQSTVSDNR